MEESILYLWCLTDTRDLSLNNKTRGMELAGLFENEYLHEALSSLKLEEVGEDYVTISFRGERFTLHKGERHTTASYRSANTYLTEYIGVEAELS